MKRFGFWEEEFGNLGTPNDYLHRGWDIAERLKVIQYLREGYTFSERTGLTFCLLGCRSQYGLENKGLTDGAWEWPAHLAHYIESHSVKPCEEFLNHIRKNKFKMPYHKNYKSNE